MAQRTETQIRIDELEAQIAELGTAIRALTATGVSGEAMDALEAKKLSAQTELDHMRANQRKLEAEEAEAKKRQRVMELSKMADDLISKTKAGLDKLGVPTSVEPCLMVPFFLSDGTIPATMLVLAADRRVMVLPYVDRVREGGSTWRPVYRDEIVLKVEINAQKMGDYCATRLKTAKTIADKMVTAANVLASRDIAAAQQQKLEPLALEAAKKLCGDYGTASIDSVWVGSGSSGHSTRQLSITFPTGKMILGYHLKDGAAVLSVRTIEAKPDKLGPATIAALMDVM